MTKNGVLMTPNSSHLLELQAWTSRRKIIEKSDMRLEKGMMIMNMEAEVESEGRQACHTVTV